MIMSSIGLDRNVLFPRKMVKNRHLSRRCLHGRRNVRHESEGAISSGDDGKGEAGGDDNQGSVGGNGDKLPAGSADIPALLGRRR